MDFRSALYPERRDPCWRQNVVDVQALKQTCDIYVTECGRTGLVFAVVTPHQKMKYQQIEKQTATTACTDMFSNIYIVPFYFPVLYAGN